jgi:hypothetical protein
MKKHLIVHKDEAAEIKRQSNLETYEMLLKLTSPLVMETYVALLIRFVKCAKTCAP